MIVHNHPNEILSFSQQNKKYYANGKVLVSGEYLVLEGASALAVPVKFGQSLEVKLHHKQKAYSYLEWYSHAEKKLWFKAKYATNDFEILETTQKEKAQILKDILLKIRYLNKDFLLSPDHIQVNTHLNFNPNWGLGSSSTLIFNLARWARVDPFELHKNTFGGSGYDIACAGSNSPIFFKLKNGKAISQKVVFWPLFNAHLFFVHLGKKENSKKAIIDFNTQAKFTIQDIQYISLLGEKISTATKLSEFETLIREHEELMSKVLRRERIKKKFFNDYPAEVKSLGAWGGDFVLATKPINFSYQMLKDYFKKKGLNTVIPFRDMIKN